MAIPWSSEQRSTVVGVLERHPLNSGRRAEAAQEILPEAHVLDPRARLLRITPRGRARFIEPRVHLERRWYHHVTTEAALHRVDVLTGPDGTETEAYMKKHWNHSEWLVVMPL